MALRFRKSFKIVPGIRLNFGSRGVSCTLGPRGASVNIGPQGTHANLGIPGTGLSSRTRLDSEPEPVLATRTVGSSPRGRFGWIVVLLVGVAIGMFVAAIR